MLVLGEQRDFDVHATGVEVTGSSAVHSRLFQLMTTSSEVFAMVPLSRWDTTFTRVVDSCLLCALRNGARMLTLYPDTVGDHASRAEFLRVAVTAGAQARTLAVLPMWLAIFGRETVAVPQDPDDAGTGMILLHGGGHVRTALWMFAHAWEMASPYPRATGPLLLSLWERRVLAQLTSGIKDESGARRLGVSARTYRRRVTELCERLGASSRFEAGMRAAKAGLV